MSVLIKGMDMPKNCDECDLSTWEGFPLGGLKLVCQLLGQVDDIEIRDEDCPLIEVPTPHGRLHSCVYNMKNVCIIHSEKDYIEYCHEGPCPDETERF